MNENIFARLSLDESIPFGRVEPLDYALFFAQLRYSSAVGIAPGGKGRWPCLTASRPSLQRTARTGLRRVAVLLCLQTRAYAATKLGASLERSARAESCHNFGFLGWVEVTGNCARQLARRNARRRRYRAW